MARALSTWIEAAYVLSVGYRRAGMDEEANRWSAEVAERRAGGDRR